MGFLAKIIGKVIGFIIGHTIGLIIKGIKALFKLASGKGKQQQSGQTEQVVTEESEYTIKQ